MLAVVLGLLIGAVIGGLGGGGGVLTVPALVHLVGQGAQDATTGSVVIVGVTAAAGVLARSGSRAVRWRTGAALGAVGIPAAALGTLLNQRVAEPVLLLSFAALTVVAALAMLVDAHRWPAAVDADDHGAGPGRAAVGTAVEAPPVASARRTVTTIALCGVVIGFLTGFLGVGGGFLVVPALVVVLRMPMTDAVGTSLLVITVNSVAALGTRAGVAEFDWGVLVPFTLAAVLGSVAGRRVSDRLPGTTLARGFAVLLLAVGLFVGAESLLAGWA